MASVTMCPGEVVKPPLDGTVANNDSEPHYLTEIIQQLGALYVTRSEVSQLLQLYRDRTDIGLVQSDPLQGAIVSWKQSKDRRIGQVQKTLVLRAQGVELFMTSHKHSTDAKPLLMN